MYVPSPALVPPQESALFEPFGQPEQAIMITFSYFLEQKKLKCLYIVFSLRTKMLQGQFCLKNILFWLKIVLKWDSKI